MKCKKKDLLLAVIINLFFLIFYICILEPLHESNDDLAMSFLAEGVYGERSEYLVYQNILLGKILVTLYTIIPGIKWYNVLLYVALFVSYTGITYVFMCVLGKWRGVLASYVMLLSCGYSSYVIFQYSRIAPQVTAAGVLLIFFAIKYEEKKEKYLIIGTLLCVLGSMIRFQMFAVAMFLLCGSIGAREVCLIIKNRKNVLRQIVVYCGVFGSVGIISVFCYIVDKMCYISDSEWNYYQEFNDARTELWDYGFPDYEKNAEEFKKMGIGIDDYYYYLEWNMDEEVMTIDNLQSLIELKSEKKFNVFDFFSVFPKKFLETGMFVTFTLLAIFLITMEPSIFLFSMSEFIIIMILQAYLFYAGRYGIERVDSGIWMTAVIGLLYRASQMISRRQFKRWKYIVGVIGVTLIIIVNNNNIYQLLNVKDSTFSKEVYEDIAMDKEHLYIVTISAPQIYYTREFWEPGELGDFSNIYNSYGWEFNTKTKKNILKSYGISNIYRDSINNEEVYFVTDNSCWNELQEYIIDNYDEKAKLILKRQDNGIMIWRVTSKNDYLL